MCAAHARDGIAISTIARDDIAISTIARDDIAISTIASGTKHASGTTAHGVGARPC